MSPRICAEILFTYVVSVIGWLFLPSQNFAQELDSPLLQGRQLFTHPWQSNDAFSPAGDGLGPLHNANSCVECHNQAGVGGAGPNSKNVELLAVASIFSSRKKRIAMQQKLVDIHAAFGNGANLVLHKKSTFADYDRFRLRLLGEKADDDIDDKEKARLESQLAAQQSSHPKPKKYEYQGIEFQLSQRNTPALFGLNLIDAIPSDEIRCEACRQSASHSAVKGRVAIPNPIPERKGSTENRVGRFGWRGQIGSLKEFVLGACANELGLQISPANSQAMNPLGPSYKAPGVDLTSVQCDALVSFVSSLPRPMQIIPDDPVRAAMVDVGEKLFHEIGCAECHAPALGDVDGLYSDLLLHDLGSGLTDLVAVNSANASTQVSLGGGYNGGSIELFAQAPTMDRQAWRTPPLWGVRDSGPYLHDGRASTLREAIVIHGGEARPARMGFLRLFPSEQENLLAFLRTLAAPSSH